VTFAIVTQVKRSKLNVAGGRASTYQRRSTCRRL